MRQMQLSSRFSHALAFAADLHATQRRKGTEIPYVSHLLSVCSIVLTHGGDEDEAIAALLHDAAEDQGGRAILERIRVLFGERVATIVEHCSDVLGEGEEKPPWELRKKAYQAKLRRCNDRSTLLVSAADKLDNARATLRDLKAHGDVVWSRFRVGRAEQLWNYGELLAIYQAKLGELHPVVAELREVLHHIGAGESRTLNGSIPA